MSYVRQKTNDPLNNYLHNLTNFYQLAPHLLTAETETEFEVWFNKLELIDRRSLYLYVKENKDKIKEEYFPIVQDRFWEKL